MAVAPLDPAAVPSVHRVKDRDRREIEIDVVARLLDGRMLTGSAKIRSKPADAAVLLDHIDALRRLAASGRAWAGAALRPEAPMLFASASGFTESFFEAVRATGSNVTTWELDDLY